MKKIIKTNDKRYFFVCVLKGGFLEKKGAVIRNDIVASMETTYDPEIEECMRKEKECRVVHEGTTMWKRRKEELQRQKHRDQREVNNIFIFF